jgi:uncharacterized protein YpmS
MKISEVVYFLMKLVKYLFLILLGLTIAIYLYVFFIQKSPQGEPIDNISERNKRALDAVLMSYALLIYIVIIPSFRGFSLTRGIRNYVGE